VSLASVFVTAILPVTAVAAVGALLGVRTEVDSEPLNTITIYVLIPALIFYSLSTTSIPPQTAVKIAVGVCVYVASMLALAIGVSRLRGWSRAETSALVLGSTFTNAGNYAIPVAAFAFGPVGRSTAVLFLIAQNVLMYTVGVYVASRSRAASRTAAREVFKLPLVYAVAAAGLVRWLDLVPSGTAMDTVRLTGDAAIPVMLLILGIELARTRRSAVSAAIAPTAMKLFAAPVVGIAAVFVLSLDSPIVAQTFVLGCAAPTAITPLMLAIKYDSDGTGSARSADESAAGTNSILLPEYVSAAVFTSTLGSIPTLTVLIWILQTGLLG
jgi:hypothetical protein